MTSNARADALRALSQFLATDAPLRDTLQRVCEIATNAIPSANFAGMSMLGEDGKATTAIFTDESSPRIDAAQYESGRGPCVDAWRENRVIRIDDTTGVGAEYDQLGRAAQERGVRSVLSLPLAAGGRRLGAFNLYASAPRSFSRDDELVGTDLATAAAVVLANTSAYLEASQLSEQLGEAMKSRAVIEQAKGMLMARSPSMTPDEAFDVLRRASQRENVKLREIAQRIVDRKPLNAGS